MSSTLGHDTFASARPVAVDGRPDGHGSRCCWDVTEARWSCADHCRARYEAELQWLSPPQRPGRHVPGQGRREVGR
jgi:hypothetical protein